jgi:hypothetical protein
MTTRRLAVGLLAAGCLAGCGGSLVVTPDSAGADHAAAAPDNAARFSASAPGGCGLFSCDDATFPTAWSAAPAATVRLDSCGGSDNRDCTVVCLAAGSVAITVEHRGDTATATLTCR